MMGGSDLWRVVWCHGSALSHVSLHATAGLFDRGRGFPVFERTDWPMSFVARLPVAARSRRPTRRLDGRGALLPKHVPSFMPVLDHSPVMALQHRIRGPRLSFVTWRAGRSPDPSCG